MGRSPPPAWLPFGEPFGKLLASAPGLTRLLALQRRGRDLFQGDRDPAPLSAVYPSIRETSLDPRRPRGYWDHKIGYFFHEPMVRDVFASPIAAALWALSQARDRTVCAHVDMFADDTVAMSLGELHNLGAFAEALACADALASHKPLGSHFVNVIPRSAFGEGALGIIALGQYNSSEVVPVRERVALTAGDARALGELVGYRLPRWDAEEVRSAPFTGPFAGGGQLQFDPRTGDHLCERQIPSEQSRQSASVRAEIWRLRWLQRGTVTEKRAAVPKSTSAVVRRAIAFIDDHCTRALTVGEIAEVARVSERHLHATFRRELGLSPLKYVVDRRLDVAESLLRGTDLSIAEIAQRCGYLEQTSLTRSLRNRRGLTPKSLRTLSAALDRH